MTKILIKRSSKDVLIPKYETPGSSGMDVSAYIEENVEIQPGEKVLISTGLSVSIPEGYEIQLRPRSGLAAKKGISVLNTPGTIDSDYRGEIKVILVNFSKKKFVVDNGLRIAQIVLCPVIHAKFEEVDQLPDTPRGAGGFGSTGTK